MATMAVAFPVLPGKAEQGRRFAEETLARGSELARSFARMGVTHEAWFLQSSPHGDRIIVYMEADDPQRAFAGWARSQDPFDLWFKEQAGQVCGIDFSQPVAALPEKIFSWSGP